MPLTRSELVCLTAGLAIGALAGANSDKVKSALSGLLGTIKDSVGDGYAAAAQKVAEHVEGLQDAVADAKNGGDSAGPASASPTT
jgi:hypothetical protein